ncbi:protein giant [Hetaerina americana]|uniref:protein giant n=1 Tax=Hetaerina americana TaxID=62018 RepID=UPI003A7F211C
MDRRDREEETFGRHSPIPRLPTPEEQREAAKRSASLSPLATAADEDSVPLDFSSRSAPSARRTADAASEGGVVDLCTRGSLTEDHAEISTAADEEDRHNTSRGSSSDGSGMFNASAEGSYSSYHQIHHPHHSSHPPQPTLQQYPLHPVALHPHHHQHFMVTPPAAPRQESSPQMVVPEGSSAPSTPVAPHPANFPGILSLTPPPPVPLHAPLVGAAVPHPLSPPQPQQPTFPALLPAPLHKTLAVAAASSSKAEPGIKVTRPFKAYPKDPLTLTVGVSTTESLLGQASNEAYVEFRKQMLRQVAATKARRPTPLQQSPGQQQSGAEDPASHPSGETLAENPESQQQMAQSSASSGDEEGSSVGGKKRTRTSSESSGAPYSVVKDAAYWERRRKNNEAAKRSRDARRAKEDEIAIRAAFLEQENLKLKYEVAALRHETSNLRCLLYSAANSS